MKNFYKFIVALGFLLTGPSFYLFSQVGINADNSIPDPSAGLDVSFTNKGLLPPRVALAAINSADPITSPAIGLLVYNTANVGTPPNNVVPGYFYWNGSKWIAVAAPQGVNIGDMQYWNGVQWINVPIGSNGQVLTISNGVPAWGGTQLPIISAVALTNILTTTATSGGNVILDGGSPVIVRGVCWNTSSNPTISNNTTTNGSGFGSFISNLTGLTPNSIYYIRAYATNSLGTAYSNEMTFTTIAIGNPCPGMETILINHVAGAVAPVAKTVTYGTVTNIPGEPSKCWITSNLGADHQATNVSDATELSAGWYWQFNRKQGYKHDGTTRTPNSTWLTSISETLDWQAVNDPCTLELGTGWRIPSKTEWTNVNASGNWNNWNGPWTSGLKIHAAGNLDYSDGSLTNRGSNGDCWSSAQGSATNGWNLGFNSSGSSMGSNVKASGFSARCVRDY